MYYRLVSTPAGAGVFAGVLMAIATAVRFWLVERSIIAALLSAAIAGPSFGLLLGWGSRARLEAISALAPDERATVMRTVLKGLPTTDRHLARAVVVYADALRQQNETMESLFRSAMLRLALAFQLVLGIAAVVDRAWVWLGFHIAILVGAVFSPALLRSSRHRFERAEQSAQALIGPP